MAEEPKEYDEKLLEEINTKALSNQFFTPDNIYMDLGLFKDLPLGAINRDLILERKDEDAFRSFQTHLLEIIEVYQTREFHSVEPHFNTFGYTDAKVDAILADPSAHDQLFLMAPNSQFIYFLVRQQMKNENHSRPANKYKKQVVAKNGDYILKADDITFHINTYPLTLSVPILERTARLIGETLGANVAFMNKDPALFDEKDWETWWKDLDCFYIDQFERFCMSPVFVKHQEALDFVGTYFFIRKRHGRTARRVMKPEEIEVDLQRMSAEMGMFCDFEWLQNNETRLHGERQHVPMEDEPEDPAPQT